MAIVSEDPIVSSEDRIRDALQEYKRRYSPVMISMITKEEFLDIMNLDDKCAPQTQVLLEYSDEDWLRFKSALVDCLKNLEFKDFIAHHFPQPDQFTFNDTYADFYCSLVWNPRTSFSGQGLFEKAGAAVICDLKDCWIILVFSAGPMQANKYDVEIHAIERLITKLHE